MTEERTQDFGGFTMVECAEKSGGGWLWSTIVGAVVWVWDFIPQPLPRGATELDRYCTRILLSYGLPDLRSYREAVATMIMHLGPTTDRKAPRFFVKSIRKAMANQVAYSFLRPTEKEEAKPSTQAVTG